MGHRAQPKAHISVIIIGDSVASPKGQNSKAS